jgi:hypothetical protein
MSFDIGYFLHANLPVCIYWNPLCVEFISCFLWRIVKHISKVFVQKDLFYSGKKEQCCVPNMCVKSYVYIKLYTYFTVHFLPTSLLLQWFSREGGKLWPKGQIQQVACFCTALELRFFFYIFKDLKK